MVVLWSKSEVKRAPKSCQKLGQRWGQKLVKIWVKNCAGRNFRSSSGQLPEIHSIQPGLLRAKTCNSETRPEQERNFRSAGSTGLNCRKFRSGIISALKRFWLSDFAVVVRE
jgi:hypothetical protein